VRDELGADPDPSIAALAERIRRTPTPVTAFRAAAPPPAEVGAPPDAGLHVKVVPAPSPARPGVRPGRIRRRRRLYLALVALPIVSLGLIGASELFPDQRRADLVTLLTRGAPTIDHHLIVVAPLENHTGDSTLNAFGEMAADDIAHALQSTGEFEVADARTSFVNARIVSAIPRVFRAGDRAVAIAEETGAGTVIAGRYYRDGDSLRVQVQIIDVASRRMSGSAGPVSGRIDGGGSAALVDLVTKRVLGIAASHADTTAAGRAVAATSPPSFEAYREASRAWDSYYASKLPQFFLHAAAAVALDSSYMLPVAMQAHVRSEMRDWPAVDSLVGILRAHRGQLAPVEHAALELAEAQEHRALRVRAHEIHVRLYRRTGDFGQAFEHLEKLHRLQQSLSAEETVQRLEAERALHEPERMRSDMELYRLTSEHLQQQLEAKQRELAAQAMHLARQTELLGRFRNELRAIVRENGEPALAMRAVKEKLKALPCESIDWTKFEAEFQQNYPDFRDRLLARWPDLTKMEVKICSLLKLKLKDSQLVCASILMFSAGCGTPMRISGPQ